MQTLLSLTLSGSALALLLLALGKLLGRRLPSTVYYYAWLLVLLRFLLPLPGLIPLGAAEPSAAPAVRPVEIDGLLPEEGEQAPAPAAVPGPAQPAEGAPAPSPLREAEEAGIKGKETTPFLLAKVKEITGGDSLDSNIQLVFNNAKVAAKTAVELCK